jgi:zinc transporter 1
MQWLRAEILGAFFNAVFLIALCVSIILESITRFIEPPEITNPKLILVVGCAGLVSNILGFFVLGGHGHSHGGEEGDAHGHGHGHGHSHGHGQAHEGDQLAAAEAGMAPKNAPLSSPSDENGRIADLMPEAAVARFQRQPEENGARHITFEDSGLGDEAHTETMDRFTTRNSGEHSRTRGRQRRRANSSRHGRLTSIEDLSIHPASFRQEIIAASRSRPDDMSSDSGSDEEAGQETTVVTEEPESMEDDQHAPTVVGMAIPKQSGNGWSSALNGGYGTIRTSSTSRRESGVHHDHHHSKPQQASGQKGGGHHGHSHGDMGMNAMVLHVIGDALGNVGVIITALIIWLTTWSGRFYADPAVSLLITAIILKSAVPLTKATAKILLQATPDHINVDEIRYDIEHLPGVVSCHHVHIWQLSDTKVVASMHVQVAFPINEAGGERYMVLAKRARRCLHAYGIHSATIQPEFCLDAAHDHRDVLAAKGVKGATAATQSLVAASEGFGLPSQLDGAMGMPAQGQGRPRPAADMQPDDKCLLDCVDDCMGQGCCPDGPASPCSAESHSTHSRDEHHSH